MKIRIKILAVLASLLAATASATPITGKDDSLLAGAQIIDFTEALRFTRDPVINGIQFIGEALPLNVVLRNGFSRRPRPPGVPPIFQIGEQLSNLASSRNGGAFNIWFDRAVIAVGINAFSVSEPTALEAYDVLGNLLESVSFPNQNDIEIGFRGIGGLPVEIARVRINTRQHLYFDNLHYVYAGSTVPSPASGALLTLGLLLLVYSRRCSR